MSPKSRVVVVQKESAADSLASWLEEPRWYIVLLQMIKVWSLSEYVKLSVPK